MRLSDKVALITGAASGIGWATAQQMANEGARLILTDIDAAALGSRMSMLAPERCIALDLDVSDADAFAEVVDRGAAHFGGLDILVNNAGIGVFGRVVKLQPTDWRRVLAVDLDGVFNGCRAAASHLAKTRGAVVNIASTSGLGGDAGQAAYNAAKAAVINFTRTFAIEMGGSGVRANCVSPGLIMTPPNEALQKIGSLAQQYAERVPLHRGGEPQEIARAICFLASDEASYITGANLVVDGGLSAGSGAPSFLAAFSEERAKTRPKDVMP
jgi:meso-butanediol dehydrogenase/(S,S)-butanediol dehydrogenase/diacetyl reductase